MPEWPTVKLIDIAAAEPSAISKPYGSAILQSDYRLYGIPVVRGVNLAQGRFLDDDFVYIDEAVAARMPGARLQSGDLVVTHRGTIGQVSMIPRRSRFETYVASTSHVKVRLDEHRALPEYVFYWFLSPAGRRSLLEHGSTVGVPGIAQPVATIKSLELPLPSLSEQRAIAEVLGAFDDEIAANSTVAKLVDSFLGEHFAKLVRDAGSVPLTSIGTVATETVRATPKGTLQYLDISSVTDGAYELPPEMPWSEAPGRARRRVTVFDTVWSTVRPNRRSHALLLDRESNIVASTGLAVLRPDTGRAAGLYEATKRPEFARYLESIAEGSAYPAVQVGRFAEAPVPALPNRAWDQFEKLALPLRERAHAAVIENRHLAATRDELLPLLLSGKVRVRDVERRVSDLL